MIAAKYLNIIQAATLMPLNELKAFCLDAKRKRMKGQPPVVPAALRNAKVA